MNPWTALLNAPATQPGKPLRKPPSVSRSADGFTAKPAADKETLLLFTFKNLAGIEALEQATARVRAKMEAEGQAA